MCEPTECPVCSNDKFCHDDGAQCYKCGFVNDGVPRDQDTLDFLRRAYEVRKKAGWSQ
jgi:hypothetical protein